MILNYNLQFFAKDGPGGEKTEEPTEKKRKDARKDGQVAKSKEMNICIGLLTLFVTLKLYVGKLGQEMLGMFENFFIRIPDVAKLTDGAIPVKTIYTLLSNGIYNLIIMCIPFFLVGMVTAFVTDLLQVKWMPTAKPLQPKFSKLNPLTGVKNLFSVNKLVDLAVSIAKIGLVVWVVWSEMKDKVVVLYQLYAIPMLQAIILSGNIIINLGIKISLLYLVIAFADFIYRKWKHKDDLKMTKQEVKDEYKQSEGDPKIKGKIKQRMLQASQKRMMQQLPKADVIITNPTHYAVAIQYDPQVADAPIVIAKGADYLALKIKEAAKEYKIEIVENKPLARMLYANVDIGSMVPPELYKAVADVLAMVYKIQGKI